MVETLSLNDVDLSLLAMDPYPSNPTNNAQWNPVPLGVIDLYVRF